MEKNKALHKLKGLPPIYVINLDDKEDRWKYMEDQFRYWEVEDYQRVSAYDGRGDNDLGEILKGRYPDCLLYTSPSPRDRQKSRMPSSA